MSLAPSSEGTSNPLTLQGMLHEALQTALLWTPSRTLHTPFAITLAAVLHVPPFGAEIIDIASSLARTLERKA